MAQSKFNVCIAPRKAPRQARSAFTVQAILDAATRVLQEGSLAGFNTNKVAELAGVSIGSLYQYFPSKDALMAQLIVSAQERLAAAVEASIATDCTRSLREALVGLVRVAIAHQWGNPVFAAVLDHEEQRLPLRSQLREYQLRIVTSVAQLLHQHAPSRERAACIQTAKDCVVICKALIEAEESRPGKAFERRLAGILHSAFLQRP